MIFFFNAQEMNRLFGGQVTGLDYNRNDRCDGFAPYFPCFFAKYASSHQMKFYRIIARIFSFVNTKLKKMKKIFVVLLLTF